MIGWGAGAGTPVVVVLTIAVAGAGVGALTGRSLAAGGYRVESDGPNAPTRQPWWWPALVLGATWAFLAWRIGPAAGWAALPAYLLFGWLAVALVWVDLDVQRLPDGLVLPAYPALTVLIALAAAGAGDLVSLVRAVVCMAALFTLYLVMAWLSPSSLGFGDVKVAGLVGLVLGWVGVPEVVLGTLAGFVVGGVVALGLLLGRRVGLRSHIAFGPPMLAGALLALALQFQPMA